MSDAATAEIADALTRLGVAARPEDAALLSGPCSGTQTCLIPRPGGDLVLKLAPASAPDHVRARAVREARFFAELALAVPLRLLRLLAASADPPCLLFAAYHRRLSELVGPVPLEAIVRVADASELRTRLLQWPHYLAHLPSAATALSARRISDAAARLGLR